MSGTEGELTSRRSRTEARPSLGSFDRGRAERLIARRWAGVAASKSRLGKGAVSASASALERQPVPEIEPRPARCVGICLPRLRERVQVVVLALALGGGHVGRVAPVALGRVERRLCLSRVLGLMSCPSSGRPKSVPSGPAVWAPRSARNQGLRRRRTTPAFRRSESGPR
jgi:hypothetical protein